MRTKAIFISTAAILGTASVALSNTDTRTVTDKRSSIEIDQFEADAQKSFYRIDINDDDKIDIEEFAAQTLVHAELARFNGYVTLETDEITYIPLSNRPQYELSLSERTRITTLARREFYEYAGDDGEMSFYEWTSYKLADVRQHDRDRDSRIEGDELTDYARQVARLRHSGV
ncbi:hypothetical protein [Parvularcula marina]|uniref:EF-hand domain-containing protein n=1 Tax=Parvularcula marina TaxID=2292771 RepID=A0A371RIA0_9PROT|nr:hypothetical protein [Parvularcula marina]RFB05162.1 hypothetical protein DX908_07780 [Parvularcula marina]